MVMQEFPQCAIHRFSTRTEACDIEAYSDTLVGICSFTLTEKLMSIRNDLILAIFLTVPALFS